jgi:hypothetical protein
MANSIENIINELDEQDMITILRTEVPIINNKKSD